MSQDSFLLQLQQDLQRYSVSSSERMAYPHDRIATGPAPVGRGSTFMLSVTVPPPDQDLPVLQKKFMTEFKIDYSVRRDVRGQESVYKVYLPSTYKGWAIMVERKAAASPRLEELQPDISIKAEQPSEGFQGPLAEDPHDVPVPPPTNLIKRRSRHDYQLEQWAKFNAVNGVVLPSTLKPGQPPIKTPYGPTKDYARHRTGDRNWCCPICGDWFVRRNLKFHFTHCVGRNGNPRGCCWDGALGGARRIGKEIAELDCRRDWGGDQDTETSTSAGSSGDDPHTSSYVPSESYSHSQSSTSRSPVVTPNLRHDPEGCTAQTPSRRYLESTNYEQRATKSMTEEVSHSLVDIPQVSQEQQAEKSSNATQVIGSLQKKPHGAHVCQQPRGSQEHIIPLSYDHFNRVWASEQESEATHRKNRQSLNNAYATATAKDFDIEPSPGRLLSSLTTQAGHTDRQFFPLPKPLPSSPLPGAKKRQIPLGSSPLFQSSKRRRTLPSEVVNPFQVKTPAGPSSQSEKQRPQISPASAEGSALGLSANGPSSGEKMDIDHVGVRQSKATGLRINTEIAESTIQLPPGNKSTPGEELYADYVKTYKEFRRELDNLAQELAAANKRADAAELRARNAENMLYRANDTGFAKLKAQEDIYRKENEKQQRANQSLLERCEELEIMKNQAIDMLTRAARREYA